MYIVILKNRSTKDKWIPQNYIAAPSGHMRLANGQIEKDGTDPRKSGPEETSKREHAYIFSNMRYAQMQAAKCPGAEVVAVQG